MPRGEERTDIEIQKEMQILDYYEMSAKAEWETQELKKKTAEIELKLAMFKLQHETNAIAQV